MSQEHSDQLLALAKHIREGCEATDYCTGAFLNFNGPRVEACAIGAAIYSFKSDHMTDHQYEEYIMMSQPDIFSHISIRFPLLTEVRVPMMNSIAFPRVGTNRDEIFWGDVGGAITRFNDTAFPYFQSRGFFTDLDPRLEIAGYLETIANEGLYKL